ncbi:MAG: hypothetical protein EON59_09635 [Alphaproteobacteria bacterium]|nr:MAG: hypothetical protein EON59_09635 [Alphaproteobacteria bacterium]
MGRKNLDRYTEDDWRTASATVALILRNRWPVTAICEVCDVQLHVDVRLIAERAGPQTNLWGRRGQCKVVGCIGKTVFYIKPHGSVMTYAMTAKR